MATPRRTRAYRGDSKRTSGSGALIDTVRSTFTKFGGNRSRSSRGGGGGGLASQASGFIGGLLSGGDSGSKRSSRRSRSRGRRRR
jgi:hypothetical protein